MNAMHAEPVTESFRVVVVEDHTLLRQSIVRTVETLGNYRVVGEVGRGDEAMATIMRTKPHMVLLDITIPGGSGLDVAAKLREVDPSIRILFITMHEDDASIGRAIGLGADGYIVKSASTDEFVKALHAVASGESYLSPGIAKQVMHLARPRTGTTMLTDRELEILRLLSSGARPVEVGTQLFVSLKTVKNHLTSIYAKLGVQTGTQAVAEAYRRGLVSADLG
jgi:DNA-binding NarL/FixJ family response regulator